MVKMYVKYIKKMFNKINWFLYILTRCNKYRFLVVFILLLIIAYLTAVIVVVVLICCLYSYRCFGNGRGGRRDRLGCKIYLIVVISKLIASHRMFLHVLLGKVTNLLQR